jgi:hypothetical protein
LGAPDKVWKDVFIGPGSLQLGEVTISALGEEGISITGASGEQANVTTPSQGGVANVSAELEGLQSRLSTNVTAFTNEDAALQSRLTTNVNIFTNEDTALQARIAANALVAASNDFATYTRLQANIDLVQDNVASVTVGTAADTEARLNANLDIVQDNVVAAEANVVLVRSNVDSLGSYSNTTFSTVSNAAQLASDIATLSTVDTATGTETRLNANLDITNDNVSSLTTTVDNFGTSSNANAAALALEDTALQARLATNVTAFTNEDAALQSRLTSNVNTLIANINTLDANADAIEARRAANLVSAVFTSDVTVSGNLIVTGAQVDLGVQTATIQNNFIELSAELNPGDTPATDSGLLINRGNKGNVFIGDHLGEDGVIFVRTQTPDTNTIIAIESFMDLHANAIHVASPVNLQRVHVGLRDSENTGIIFDDSGANINFVAGGSYVANVHYDGTLNSQNAIIAPAVFAGGVELRANDFATYTTLNANINLVQDNVATNATDITAVETRRTNNIAGAVSTITTSDLTASRALIAGTGGKIEVSDVTATELGHLDGVTSAIQTQLNAKQATITGAATTIDDTNLTASRALVSDGSGKVAVSAVTATELGHLDGVSSAIQTQLNSKISTTDSASNDFITFTRVNANVNVVQDNVAAVETRRTNNIAGAVSTITTSDLTASRAVVSDGSGKVAVSAVTATEIGHLDGVTSAIQTQLNNKISTADSASNDFITFTRVNANVNVVQDNVATNATDIAAVETRRTNNIAGAVSTITTSDLTASRALVSDGSGKVAVSAVTATEIGHLDGVSSAIQTQLNSKIATTDSASNDFVTFTRLDANIDVVSSNATAFETRRVANIAGAVSTITTGNLTASRALASDGSGKVAVSAVTSTELGYLDGVTSAIQTQLNAKQATITGAATTIDDTNLTASRALVSDGSGKVAVSDITSTELAFLDGLDQNLNSNLVALAAGIAASTAAGFPTGDYGLLDAANAATDAFGFAVADLTIFDMSDTPAGELDAQDLGALT